MRYLTKENKKQRMKVVYETVRLDPEVRFLDFL
jgi:hypothetical protein